MRHLASIQKILEIHPIENADAIEVATVLGWHVVVKKGEFNIGDLVVYFEVDSFLPIQEEFSFLDKGGSRKKMLVDNNEVEGYRLKTIKLRGQISQGLCWNLSILGDKDPRREFGGSDVLEEGDDVTDILGVLKYEPPIPAELAGVVRGPFPGFIPHTDETRVQSIPNVLEKYKDETFFITEKLDGTSMTAFLKDGELHVAGRTLDLEENLGNSYWNAAREQNLEQILAEDDGRYALQGELVGEGIQKNKLKIKGHVFHCFNVFDKQEGKYIDFNDFNDYCAKHSLKIVPVIQADVHIPAIVDELVAFATRKSLINPNTWAEGIVIRPMHEMQDIQIGRLSFKVINPEFLLKEE